MPVFLGGVRWLRVLGSVSVLVSLALLGPVTRMASAASDPCSPSAVTQAFLPWADLAYYELVRGGDFEAGAWTLAGGAKRVQGSEPYAATGKRGHRSLSLPPGGTAQSPTACIAANQPTARFFITGSGTVEVDFLYGGIAIPSGVLVAGGPWAPTPVVLTGSAITLGGGGTAQVSLKFTGLTGHPRVDDVFIDPWNRG